eukprot:SAG11_NODE_12028_length_725_cov_1.142173_1_plen_152_part_00
MFQRRSRAACKTNTRARRALTRRPRLWAGTVASLPIGWVICDGTFGTPDLRNKFVIGAGNRTVPMNQGHRGEYDRGARRFPTTFAPGPSLEVEIPVGDWLVEEGLGSPHDELQLNVYVDDDPECDNSCYGHLDWPSQVPFVNYRTGAPLDR